METDKRLEIQNDLKERYQLWRQLPETQRFFNYLQRLRESAKEDWEYAEFVGTSMEEMALRNAKALGGVEVLRNLITMETLDE